jgi:histone H3/H4
MKQEKSLIYYIPKILRRISDRYITKDSKQVLNDIILCITNYIVHQSVLLLKSTNKKTLNISNLVNTLRVIFKEGMLVNLLEEGDIHVKMDTSEVKQSLIYTPSFFKRVILNIIPDGMKISHHYPIFISSVMEYITAEILDISSYEAVKNNHKRITIKDIMTSINCDTDLSSLCRMCNINIIYTNDLILPKTTFENMVRQICSDIEKNNIKISKTTFSVLQGVVENYIINILKHTDDMVFSMNDNMINMKHLKYIQRHLEK